MVDRSAGLGSKIVKMQVEVGYIQSDENFTFEVNFNDILNLACTKDVKIRSRLFFLVM